MKKHLLLLFSIPFISCTELPVIENDKTTEGIETAIVELIGDFDLRSLNERVSGIKEPLTRELFISVLYENEIDAITKFNHIVTTSFENEFNSKYDNDFALLFSGHSDVVMREMKMQCIKSRKEYQFETMSDDGCELECAAFILSLASLGPSCIGPQGFLTCGIAMASFLVSAESLDQCLNALNREACFE